VAAEGTRCGADPGTTEESRADRPDQIRRSERKREPAFLEADPPVPLSQLKLVAEQTGQKPEDARRCGDMKAMTAEVHRLASHPKGTGQTTDTVVLLQHDHRETP
jgi:hypothetical protein